MPITLTCDCGKMFKVKDELAGGQVSCQVCGAELSIPLADASPAIRVVTPRQAPPSDPTVQAPDAPATKRCPSCAEAIPETTQQCPFCKEAAVDPSGEMSPEEERTRLAQLLGSVRDYDAQAIAEDQVGKGAFMAGKTWVLAVLSLASVVALIYGAFNPALSPLLVMGIILLVIFGAAFSVSLSNDYQAWHISDAPSAQKALRRYLMAAHTNRPNKAYVALAPAARSNASVLPPKLDKIPPNNTGPSVVDDLTSYKSYLKTIFTGPSSQTRSVQIKNVRLVAEHADFAVVQVDMHFSNYPSVILFTIFIHFLLMLILMLCLTKREKWTISKLLIRHEGRWYIADPGYEGAIDRVAARATADFQQ